MFISFNMNAELIKENIQTINGRISETMLDCGRAPGSVQLLAATKTCSTDQIKAALNAGVKLLGENKVQEALPKIEELSADTSLPPFEWHLIGHLQSNKAKKAVQNFSLIHSVDSLKLAQDINRHAAEINKLQNILLQVNISGEESKGGFTANEIPQLLETLFEQAPNLNIQGFMTMAPLTQQPEDVRPLFHNMKFLLDNMAEKFKGVKNFEPIHLSMGMTTDYKVAIQEGATLIRIGTAIFGERYY